MGYMEEAVKELYQYAPELTKKADFDAFWEETIRQAATVPLEPTRTELRYPIPGVKVYEISYHGMDETKINGWFIVPARPKDGGYPCLVHYHGFTGNRGEPSDFMHWIMMGMAVLSVDCRDQGGSTGNHASYSYGFLGNVASKGIHNKYEYYYRQVYMDCIKAIDFACAQPEVDGNRIIIEGESQGGGLGMAVAALDGRPKLAMVDVPSNSDLISRIDGNHGAFGSIADYLRRHPEQTNEVMDTISYFDTMNMAERIDCPVLASVGLKDEICPPKMYFATFNRIKSDKEINIYPFNGHEGGGARQREAKLAYLANRFVDWF
ncbi:acetylxylan esterase [Paenibacillus sp. GCM10027627]|uniref:acetylxylan esterase n=1 Tax=unclassified Paenibacillus TaxID=185978 RepID=UPI003635BA7E